MTTEGSAIKGEAIRRGAIEWCAIEGGAIEGAIECGAATGGAATGGAATGGAATGGAATGGAATGGAATGGAATGGAATGGAATGGAGGAVTSGAVTGGAARGASASVAARDVTRAAIASVEPLIRPFVRRTPVVRVNRADFGLEPGPLVLKLEHLQHSGSFKVRGAFANLLLRDIPAAGVVAASGGNHGAAVAYAAMTLRKPARIFVPEVSSPAKIARIRGYGADLVVSGDTYADALEASEAWIATSGAMPVHAYDQTETVLGAGSLAIELESQAADTVTVMAGVGGGGLLAGVAAGYAGRVRVVGVEPEGAPTLTSAFRAGHPVDTVAGSVAVDSLAPRRVGELNFPVIAKYVHEVLLVSDEAILHAQELLWDRLRLVGEPGGCAALAAVISGRYRPAADETVAVIISGANTTAVDFTR